MYKVKYHKNVVKFLEKIPKNYAKKIIEIFEELKKDPFEHNFDIKPLKGFKNIFRLRVSKYRIIYEINENELYIYVIKADKRGDVY